jgi:hypothetical protein
MRNFHLEASIWYLVTSTAFFEAAARECEGIVDWQVSLATSRPGPKFSPNNELVDKFKKRAREFRRGAELARFGDYRFVWDIAGWTRSDVRGMIEQAPNGWMDLAQYREFSGRRFERLEACARLIERALNNAMVAAESFFHPNPDCPERSNDDDGYPGDSIVGWYNDLLAYYKEPLFPKLLDSPPVYVIDSSITCRTGDEVPWTGVWYPCTGLERHSLTFSVKGLRMQPVYRVVKTTEELSTEDYMFPPPETVAVATTWHPVVLVGGEIEANEEQRSKSR